jgi:hypothetical protein
LVDDRKFIFDAFEKYSFSSGIQTKKKNEQLFAPLLLSYPLIIKKILVYFFFYIFIKKIMVIFLRKIFLVSFETVWLTKNFLA